MKIDIVIAGAAKCGSTSLYEFFSEDKSFFAAAAAKDYPVYTRPRELNDRLKKLANFGYKSEALRMQVIGDVNISFERTYLETLKKSSPNVKVIFLMRKPTERIISAYLFNRERLNENRSLVTALDDEVAGIIPQKESKEWWQKMYFKHTDYLQMINDTVDIFGKSNVHVIEFDDLVRRFPIVKSSLAKFLGVELDDNLGLPRANSTSAKMRYHFIVKHLFQSDRSSYFWKIIRLITSQKMRSKFRFYLRDNLRANRQPIARFSIDHNDLTNEAKLELLRLNHNYKLLKAQYSLDASENY